ncbi:MAG: SDR family NAD(P)-dependent oxidoreductase [Planctomycetota bacterium]|nr:SDR family NAD(P)-dependent oxidoreductase [Planctomycetota bacterium]
MNIRGKVVLITGASRGIGAATAIAFAGAGARVILMARIAAGLEETASRIRSTGGHADTYDVDITDEDPLQPKIADILSDTGVPDVIVNNAGAGKFLFVPETSPAQARDMMAVPYFGAFNVTRAFIPGMIERGNGQIINITSPISHLVWPGATGYAAARWAMRGFTEALREDLRRTGVRVSLVVLGKTQSSYFDNNPGSEERLPRIAKFFPTLTVDNAAAAILKAARRNREQIVSPKLLGCVLLLHRFMPGTVQRIVTATGHRPELE